MAESTLRARVKGVHTVSRIWDSLKDLEKHGAWKAGYAGVCKMVDRGADRRSSDRLWAYVPVLLYGYTIEQVPFHEGTEALHVNAAGGLITLVAHVREGQCLWLINKQNQSEQKCHVVCERSKYLHRAAIAIEFFQPAPNFWETAHR